MNQVKNVFIFIVPLVAVGLLLFCAYMTGTDIWLRSPESGLAWAIAFLCGLAGLGAGHLLDTELAEK